MPRIPRLVAPDVPLHITQRGVDRGATFLADQDYAYYLCALRAASSEARCAVHAYVLMTNHIHLLLTPADARGPARLMASVGRRYVRYFNDRYGRSGTLWEGRYRSAIVSSAPYYFACSRYIELNPQRAGIVDDPAEYIWSSYHRNACGADDPIVTPHALFTALGRDHTVRCSAYRATFAADLSPNVVATLRAATRGRPALQATTYREAVAALTGGTTTNSPEGSSASMRVGGRSGESLSPGVRDQPMESFRLV